MTLPDLLYVVIGLGLVAYALTAGADFGGGIWDLLARGPRKAEQRKAIADAIAPIWEANHVWLIFIIVALFTAFPRAFAVISVALHIPITLSLIGIVLRGAAFVFRAYGMGGHGERLRWGQVFAWASSITPLFLGMTLGALATGDIRAESGTVTTGFFAGWTTAFSFLVGVFSCVLFAMLGAVYLAAEHEGELGRDFRRRALGSEVVAGVVAALVLWRAALDAPILFRQLIGSSWSIGVQIVTASLAALTIAALIANRPKIARIAAAAQVAFVVVGFGLAMEGHFVVPDVSVTNSGARPEVLEVVSVALLCGAAVLAPALFFLFKVFKGQRST